MKKPGPIVWNPRLSAARNARRFLPRAVHAYLVEVRQFLATNPAPPELHAMRLATKRLRYTLELFRPCYGRGLNDRLASLQRLQQILGEVNDCAAAERLIETLEPASPRAERFVSFLRRRAAAKAVALRREWRDRFDAPGHERWWLGYLAGGARVREPRL